MMIDIWRGEDDGPTTADLGSTPALLVSAASARRPALSIRRRWNIVRY